MKRSYKNSLRTSINSFLILSLINYEKLKEKINFLDVVIKIKEGRTSTNINCKPTDGHQYLHYDSYHVDHMKRLIIFS